MPVIIWHANRQSALIGNHSLNLTKMKPMSSSSLMWCWLHSASILNFLSLKINKTIQCILMTFQSSKENGRVPCHDQALGWSQFHPTLGMASSLVNRAGAAYPTVCSDSMMTGSQKIPAIGPDTSVQVDQTDSFFKFIDVWLNEIQN